MIYIDSKKLYLGTFWKNETMLVAKVFWVEGRNLGRDPKRLRTTDIQYFSNNPIYSMQYHRRRHGCYGDGGTDPSLTIIFLSLSGAMNVLILQWFEFDWMIKNTSIFYLSIIFSERKVNLVVLWEKSKMKTFQ